MSIEKTSIEFLDAELAIAKLELEMDDGDRGDESREAFMFWCGIAELAIAKLELEMDDGDSGDESREAFMFWRGVKAAQKLTEIIQS